MSLCPTREELQAWVNEQMNAEASARVDKHVSLCATCQELLTAFTSADSLGSTPLPVSPLPSQQFFERVRQADPESLDSIPLPSIPKYEVIRALAKGGMGVVFLAKQDGLHRHVALKMILAGRYADAEERRRFQQEAEAIAQLRHPNIVQIFDIGENDGRPFFAMEYVEGGTLSDFLQRTPQAPMFAAHLTEVLARALLHAHLHGIVHRDFKPSNVLLDVADGGPTQPANAATTAPLVFDWTPKIADFGLAKRADDAQNLTQKDQIIGTPSYMAPEQASEHFAEIGPATDVYALGATLYEMLTGRPPFKAETPLRTIQLVIGEDPIAPTKFESHLPRDLETICLKCLNKQPAARYGTAADLADDLRRFVEGRPIKARPASAWERVCKWTRRRPALAALIFVIAAALLSLSGGTWFHITSLEGLNTNLANTANREQQNATKANVAATLARNEAQRADDNAKKEKNQRERAEQQLRIATAQRLAVQSQFLRSFFPQQSFLLAEAAVNTTRLANEPVVPLAEEELRNAASRLGGFPLQTGNRACEFAQMSTDGRLFLTQTTDHAVQVWNLSDPDRPLELCAMGTCNDKLTEAVFSATNDWLVARTFKELRLWKISGNEKKAALFSKSLDQEQIWRIAISPTSKTFATGDSSGLVKLWDLNQPDPLLQPKTVGGSSGAVAQLIFSADGRWLMATSYDGRLAGDRCAPIVKLWQLGDDGTIQDHSVNHSQPLTRIICTPDSRWLATCSTSLVRLWNLSGGHPRDSNVAIPSAKRDFFPQRHEVSLSGKWLMTREGLGTCTLFPLQSENPTDNPKLLNLPPGAEMIHGATFSPDEKWIVLSWSSPTQELRGAMQNGAVALWNLSTGNQLQPRVLGGHGAHVSAMCFSPDSRFLCTGGDDKLVRVWPLANGVPDMESSLLFGHPGRIRALLVSGDNRYLFSGDDVGILRRWELRNKKVVEESLEMCGHEGEITRLHAAQKDLWLVSEAKDAIPRAWAAKSANVAPVPIILSYRYDSVSFSSDRRWLALGQQDGSVLLFDFLSTDPSMPRIRLAGFAQAPQAGYVSPIAMAFAPDSKTFLTFGPERVLFGASTQIVVCSLEDGKVGTILERYRPPHKEAGRVLVSSDGRWLLTDGGKGDYRLWDRGKTLASQAGGQRLQSHSDVALTSFSSDSKWLIVEDTQEKLARAYDLSASNIRESGRPYSTNDWKLAKLLKPTQRWLVLKEAVPKTIKVVDLSSSDQMKLGLDEYIPKELEFNATPVVDPSGRYVVVSGNAGTYCWDMDAKDPKDSRVKVEGGQATFLHGTNLVVTLSKDAELLVWQGMEFARSNKMSYRLDGEFAQVMTVAVSAKRQHLVSACGSLFGGIHVLRTPRVSQIAGESVVIPSPQLFDLTANPPTSVRLVGRAGGEDSYFSSLQFSITDRWIVGETGTKVMIWPVELSDVIRLGKRGVGISDNSVK